MDRFIALITTTHSGFNPYLKSNMDRFIGNIEFDGVHSRVKFKIQYG